MSSRYTKILPTPFQCIAAAFLTIMILIIGNTGFLLHYYGLGSSPGVVKNSVGSAVNHGLGKLNGTKFVGNLVMFALWAIVGLFCLSIIQGIVRVYRDIEEDEELSSNLYVHPTTFVRRAFWERILIEFFGLVIGLSLVVGSLVVLFVYVLPISLALSRALSTGITLEHVGLFAVGPVLLYIWVLVVWIFVRLTIYRRQIFD